jgi:hypothetical protein
MVYQYLLPPKHNMRYKPILPAHETFSVPYSIPVQIRGYWSNPELPWFLRLPTDTDMARELAAKFCLQTVFQIYGLERLDMLLTMRFMVPGFIPRDYLRNLLIVLRPPYWDLPLLPDPIIPKYNDKVNRSNLKLLPLLDIKHETDFFLKIAVVLTEMFSQGFLVPFRPNVKFCRWFMFAQPYFEYFLEQAFQAGD